MSESDSDLDFESADEDAIGCDNKNSNASQKSYPKVDIDDDSAISNESLKIKPISSKTCNEEEICKDKEKDSSHLSNTQVTATCDIGDYENKLSTEKNCSEKGLSENISSDKTVGENNFEGDTHKTIQAHSEELTNKGHEKQRVPLRLEKKIQKKQQISKENSVDNEAAVSTEVFSKKPNAKSSSWGFGNWGTSLLSTAASSVSTFTNQVSQGIGTVLETVENTLGAPPPEELAVALSDKNELNDSSLSKVDEKNKSNDEIEDENTSEIKSSILPNVSSWTKVLEDTGSKVLMGGLDTLELIGKKTIDIITEGDPGLRKKRAVFSDGITLSQILREAKAEADESKYEEDSGKLENIHYSQMFDEYQGLVHLEALEMLSKQSEAKVQILLMRIPRNSEVRKNMEEIKSICENIPQLDDPTEYGDFEDFLTLCKKYVLELNITFNVENIVKAQMRITDVLKNYENVTTTTSTSEEIYHSAICSLAEFTAKAIEVFHKLAELILVQPTLEPNVEHFATNLTGLTTVMCIEINNLSSRYHHCLDSIFEQCNSISSEKSSITTIVTNLYIEAANSNKYIQDAFLLLVPVLQVSLLESSQ